MSVAVRLSDGTGQSNTVGVSLKNEPTAEITKAPRRYGASTTLQYHNIRQRDCPASV